MEKEFMKKVFKVIGVMSGTSLDGLDLAYCEFELLNDKWQYTLGAAETISYSKTWHTRLSELHKQPMFLLPKTDAFYGKYIGQCINDFIKRNKLTVDFISSHGHTIFHNPAEGYTTQIGSGPAIFAETNIPVIYDFRSLDVALGGQGAPLVPIGDELLFGEYEACLNLGGFANISFAKEHQRVAFDICPCNIVLNQVAGFAGKAFDENGTMAASGTVNTELLNELNALSFYKSTGAKSLGREWVEKTYWPIVAAHETEVSDLLATFTLHITQQINIVLSTAKIKSVLVTGGGAFNANLMKQLKRDALFVGYEIPDSRVINFKESLIFAFLGVLNQANKINTLKSVTGASVNSIGGVCIGF